MSNLIGTIIDIETYLSNLEKDIYVNKSLSLEGETSPVWRFIEGREYYIPDYQREIRWNKENLIELMADISTASKFLGNIILSKRKGVCFDIIDGQQRTTVLLMLIKCISSKYPGRFQVLSPCPLIVDSFTGFTSILNSNFDKSRYNEEEVKTDYYKQLDNYEHLWNVMNDSIYLDNPNKAWTFYKNLINCKINIIINIEENSNYNMEYFLDVNLKGVKLDTEDIFKGYLFSMDNNSEIRRLWKEIKAHSFDIVDNYPLLKLIEHFFYVDLPINKSNSMRFNEKFNLTDTIDLDNTIHYPGEHLIKALNDSGYMIQSMKHIVEIEKLIFSINDSESPSSDFLTRFGVPSGKIDNDEIKVFYSLIRKMIKDKHLAPKILLIKYFHEYLDPSNLFDKNEYRKIYGIFMYAVLFSIFEHKKSSDKLISIVSSVDWYSNLLKQVKGYSDIKSLSDRSITVKYAQLKGEDISEFEFRCKSLATIYNYFKINQDAIAISNVKELCEFITNTEMYSTEHFLMNKSGRIEVISEPVKIHYEYHKEFTKYIDSLFNFIFIDRSTNTKLGNLFFDKKIEILENDNGTAGCEYSKMVIECVKESFISNSNYIDNIKQVNTENVNKSFDEFFYVDFKKRYAQYSNLVNERISKRINDRTY